jgi:hypothetical protein
LLQWGLCNDQNKAQLKQGQSHDQDTGDAWGPKTHLEPHQKNLSVIKVKWALQYFKLRFHGILAL